MSAHNGTEARLDLSKLDKVRNKGGKTIARCPACAETGGDRKGEHLFINPNGKYGCVQFPGSDGQLHRKRIFELVGVTCGPAAAYNGTHRSRASSQRGYDTLAEAVAVQAVYLAKDSQNGPYKETRRDWYHTSGVERFFVVVRFHNDDPGDKEYRPFSRDSGGKWLAKDPPSPLPLFGLPDLLTRVEEPVYIVEGEKCACALATLSLLATTSAHGAKSPQKTDWSPLAGREVIILPDNNEPGRAYAKVVIDLLQRLNPPASVTITELPGVPEGGDIVDWLERRDAQLPEDCRSELERLVSSAKSSRVPVGGYVENVAFAELSCPSGASDEETSTNSTYLESHDAVWPADSILEDFIKFARDYSESEDSLLIGAILPIVARLLGRKVWMVFGPRKFTNIFNVLVSPPGFRKSTTIGLAERVARAILPSDAFLEGATSEQALFKSFQGQPDRLLIEDEGNTLLSNWSNDAAGKQVSKRFLRLYDCGPWSQNYIRQADEDDSSTARRIPEVSASILIGTTYNNCRFNGLDAKDGMRRRVNYYVSETLARKIYWPPDFESDRFKDVVDLFRPLLELEGKFQPLLGRSMELWKELQDANRAEIINVTDVDAASAASETQTSALAEEGSKILKLAMIFEACRWARDRKRDWQVIQPDTLRLAAEHGRYCLRASRRLDTIGRKGEIRDQADMVIAGIRSKFAGDAKAGRIELTKTQLTHTFAANPGRSGSLTPSRLYGEILPDLQKRKLAFLSRPGGKLQVYQFVVEQ
ncbi:MAG TPA: hypothetical protein VGI60_02745 [Chthoniobacterales bacterium]|jgi:sarcosine oxidase delta subunit